MSCYIQDARPEALDHFLESYGVQTIASCTMLKHPCALLL